ncbi:FAD-dependent oxidoreductase [Paenibacillus thalictri]|uniref:FAD-dependent monooxygenase n=1 Tax=Paenibacillus thalictri TaxID=2527873 RepID=A0A4Q9DQX9_9BACL|nr:FAD-dependent monooxygenase [Paenibacillus thalictri]TBL76561.1 FAD-dependent monooxygenase [Paenibacillus thalictri]
MKAKSELRVVIIGGGIAGAAAAVALKKEGIRAEVYEQAPELKEVGAGIGLRPPTIRYMKDWGMYGDIEKVTTHTDYMELLTGDGDVYHKERWPVLTDNPEERYARFVHRADLLDTLIAQLPPETVHLNHRCSSITDHGHYAEVHFENGHSVEADLVIGADGIRSVVRSKVFGDNKLVYSGYHAYRTLINEEQCLGLHSADNNLRILIEGKVQVYLLPLQLRKQVSLDITAPSADFSLRPVVTKQDLVDSVKEYGSTMIQVVENLNIEDFTCRPLYDFDPLERWNTNCVTLVGDAAHAMLHNIGQGANMALQDAGALAVALSESGTIPEALQKYEARRKPLTSKYQELSRHFPTREMETVFTEKDYY